MRIRLGRTLLYGTGATVSGLTAYTAYNNGLDINNVGAIRFGRAAWAVGWIGVDYKMTLFSGKVDSASPQYEGIKSACHQRSADKLLKLCCSNGGVFIKVGQHMGSLDYLLPEEYVNTMKVLHSRAPAMPLKEVREVIKDELGQEPEQLFATFDPEPLGTASLAQVHKATLKDGRVCAVKVQHKYVKKHSLVDIYTCTVLVKAVKWAFPQFEFMWLAEEMSKNLPNELDFSTEGRNSEKVSNQLHAFRWLKIPRIEWRLTSDRVLTMEYCAGKHISDVKWIKEQGLDVKEVSQKLGMLYSEMIFTHGYMHCDPHPGNILIQKGPNGGAEIVLLDHGLYTQLSNQFRWNYSRLWQGIINRDVAGIKAAATDLDIGHLYHLFTCMVTGRSWSSIEKGLDMAQKTKGESAEIKANAAKYAKEITDILAFANRHMIMVFKTNDLLRGIESNLGTLNSMSSFVQMSRSCMRCIEQESKRTCNTRLGWLRIHVWGRWAQFKISFYEVFLWAYWSKVGALLTRRQVQ